MRNKNYFLIIYNPSKHVLILKKKTLGRWELPRIASSKEQPISYLIETFMRNHFRIQYKLVGKSSIVDTYDWPKELISITGKSGEEHHFRYIRLLQHFKQEHITSPDFESYDFVEYEDLVQRVIFKNHKDVLKKVLDELHQDRS
jgi:hypothetical protein